MCYQTVLRFFMSLRETFSNSITFINFLDDIDSENCDWIIVKNVSFQRNFRQTTSQMGGNTFAILTAAPPLNFLITVKVIELENISLSEMQNLKTVY